MIKSKGWKWEMVQDEREDHWKNPCRESFYLVNRWKSLDMQKFLDLGCGLGRHSVLFAKNQFDVYCFDISEDAINRTRKWCEEENLTCDYQIGDMLKLPYKNEEFDCILCLNVISHTDTDGMKVIVNELKRVLKPGGECYLTLGSKETWGFKQEDWPLKDPNTRIRMDDGPEYGVPHFYADYNLCMELFKDFEIINIHQVIDYIPKDNKVNESYHYHLLIKKN